MKYIFITLLLATSLINSPLSAQSTRQNEHYPIGWFASFNTFKFHPKWSLHLEYQARQVNKIQQAQQGLFRTGINYHLHPKATFRFGYAEIETYPYGENPINSMGRDFSEHRIYQMITLTDNIERIESSHRFILEQRWVGKYSSMEVPKEDQWVGLHRLRYMLRIQIPILGPSLENKEPYLAAYDEIMIGFGEKVGENIFDQNRLGILLGFKFNDRWRLEGGYLNQIMQLSREINNRNVFQHNNGLILNLMGNFDFSKKQ